MKRSTLLVVLFLRCAAVSPPPGGPEDKTPPSLIDVSPPSGTTSTEGGLILTLTFSERLHEQTDVRSIRLSPPTDEDLQVGLKKDILTVTLPKVLRQEQTYILTITRDIMDERKNRLDKTYQLAFTTGNKIASGRISGTVYELGETSALVYLFRQSEVADDTLLLRTPDYYTETDDSGRYTFDFLDPGKFSVMAHRGGAAPAPLTPSRSLYGLYWENSVTIDSENDVVDNINIRLGKEVPPFRVLSTVMEDAKLGTVTLVNSFKLSESPDAVIEFSDPESVELINANHIFQYPNESGQLHFFVDGLATGQVYSLSVSGLTDSVGQKLEAIDRQITIPKKDSIPPAIHSPLPNKPVALVPGNEPLTFQFTRPVTVLDTDSVITLTDSEETPIAISLSQPDPMRLEVVPETGWPESEIFDLNLYGSEILSEDNIVMIDSLFNYSLSVGRERGRGGLSGSVTGPYVEKTTVTARPLEKNPISVTVSVNSEGDFQMEEIPAGMWLLSAFQDKDGNGRYTFGKALPMVPAEPFTVLNDTIEVRANWDVEGIIITYPEKQKR